MGIKSGKGVCGSIIFFSVLGPKTKLMILINKSGKKSIYGLKRLIYVWEKITKTHKNK
jgi:hypothetical protein